ncbi:MAG: histidinol dehydrogenase [Chloroflexi bacterium]|nr:histidinol dehydrogenase [Chloroflexota bacterium]
MTDLFPIYTHTEAEQGILRRRPPDEFDLTDSVKAGIERIFGEPLSPEQAVRRIISDVRQRGDAALLEWTERIDGVALQDLRVPEDELAAAAEQVSTEVLDALRVAAMRIEAFHRRQNYGSWMQPNSEGMLGQLVRPIERVGVYVPGGTAPLPSSLLMSALPARVAGVKTVVAVTPPAHDGSIPPVVAAAAQVAKIDRLYRMGGVMGIAALAYGSESVETVDKIVGPGNLFVTLAKRQVYGVVGIDGLLGPTETMVIADELANPSLIAADLLAQAEHDVLASAILVTPSQELASAVAWEVGQQIEERGRAGIIEESLRHRGGAIIVPDLETAFEVANRYAAEHLQLSVEDPYAWMGSVQNAGCLFLGETSFEVLGDYVAGPSHSLPTSGTARFASGLNVLDFLKITGVVGLNAEAAAALGVNAATLADAESLDAHANAARIRSES